VPDIPKWVHEPPTAKVSSSQFNISRNSYNRSASSSSTREGWLGLPPKAPVGYQGAGPIFSTVRPTASSTVSTGASPAFAPLPAAREALAQLHEQQQVTGVPPDSSSSSSGTTEKHHAHAPVTSPQGNTNGTLLLVHHLNDSSLYCIVA
jgi:hypothetical protein